VGSFVLSVRNRNVNVSIILEWKNVMLYEISHGIEHFLCRVLVIPASHLVRYNIVLSTHIPRHPPQERGAWCTIESLHLMSLATKQQHPLLYSQTGFIHKNVWQENSKSYNYLRNTSSLELIIKYCSVNCCCSAVTMPIKLNICLRVSYGVPGIPPPSPRNPSD